MIEFLKEALDRAQVRPKSRLFKCENCTEWKVGIINAICDFAKDEALVVCEDCWQDLQEQDPPEDD